MKRYSTAELRRLEIVNVCDGARLGFASDFEFEVDCDCPRILALVVSGCVGVFGFGKEDDLIIPWGCVQCIGEDTILVKLTPHELSACCCEPRRRFGKRK